MNVVGAFPGPVYSAGAAFLPAAAATGDIFTIAGAAGYLVRILYADAIVFNSAAGTPSLSFTKRSALDTGGTSGLVTIVPHDSADPAAQAVVRQYTVMPAAGASLGLVRAYFTVTNPAGGLSTLATAQLHPYPVVLRSATEQFCIGIGTALAAPNARCNVMWTEEAIV